MKTAAALLILVLIFGVGASAANAQTLPKTADNGVRKFEILDNSFLVEEAFNQEPLIFQNIFSWSFDGDGWEATFTQEWPLFGVKHQLSYTLPFKKTAKSTGVSDVLLNYRYQLLRETARTPAIAARASVVVPSGRVADGLGNGVAGLQVNVPFSKQFGDVYLHWNAGWTWLPGVGNATGDTGRRIGLTSPRLAGSAIWRATPMLNLMLEGAVDFEESTVENERTMREPVVMVSPGFRRGWNIGDHQLVIGVAIPINATPDRMGIAALTYFSYELPFKK